MNPSDPSHAVSTKRLWAARAVSAVPALMLLFSATLKLLKPAAVVEEFGRLGYSEGVIVGLGILELTCTVLYLIPRTTILGAVLLTGYLGGATATHLRVGDQFIPPVLFGVLVWGGLYLRDRRLHALLPFTRSE